MARDGGSAFPVTRSVTGIVDGMTLRDYFAAHALALRMYAPQEPARVLTHEETVKAMAECAYEVAEAMLERRNDVSFRAAVARKV